MSAPIGTTPPADLLRSGALRTLAHAIDALSRDRSEATLDQVVQAAADADEAVRASSVLDSLAAHDHSYPTRFLIEAVARELRVYADVERPYARVRADRALLEAAS